MTNETHSAITETDGDVQSPLDRQALAQHFLGYDVEAVITVALSPVTIADAPGEEARE